ncbi:MAG TPA: hypothetical protein VMW28_04445, partial [Pelolinea sp.]|nr:hypothetical protein [Pelolinea sp.]
FNLAEIIPEILHLPLIVLLTLIAASILVVGFFWLRNPSQKGRLARAWVLVRGNIPLLSFAFLVSILAHLVFSLAHYFLLEELFPLSIPEIIAVILTPQLARSIPISVLGISAGEGLMVSGQMMIGMPKETALVITLVALASRYFFALLGFLIEFVRDGIRFFTKVKTPEDDMTDSTL